MRPCRVRAETPAPARARSEQRHPRLEPPPLESPPLQSPPPLAPPPLAPPPWRHQCSWVWALRLLAPRLRRKPFGARHPTAAATSPAPARGESPSGQRGNCQLPSSHSSLRAIAAQRL